MPEQFCTPLKGIQPGSRLRVAAYPVAWRIGIVDDDDHRGFGYVRSDRSPVYTSDPLTSFQFLLGDKQHTLGSTDI